MNLTRHFHELFLHFFAILKNLTDVSNFTFPPLISHIFPEKNKLADRHVFETLTRGNVVKVKISTDYGKHHSLARFHCIFPERVKRFSGVGHRRSN